MSPAVGSALLQDLDIESTLQCPVCFEIPPKIIYMCRVGHHMCERCRLRLTTCPTCKSPITGCRNFLGESLTNKFSVLIKGNGDEGVDPPNLDDGINTLVNNSLSRLLLKQNDAPMKQLPNPTGVYHCLLEACRNRSGMGVSNMFHHVENNHAHIFDKFQNNTSTFKHKFENFCFRRGSQKYHRAFSVTNMGLFFLNLETVANEYINCWITTPASVQRCESLVVEIVFSKEGTTKTYSFVSKVASNLQEKMRVFETGRIFVISPETHEMKNGDFFSLTIKIVYKKALK